jgi:hypothetical protein
MKTKEQIESEIEQVQENLKVLYNEKEILSDMGDPDRIIPDILTQEEMYVDKLTDLKKLLTEYL